MKRPAKAFLAALLAVPLAVFSGCGDDGSDAEGARQQLEMERQKLETQKAELREMRVLQSKAKDETITPEEKARLDALYEKLGSAGDPQRPQ